MRCVASAGVRTAAFSVAPVTSSRARPTARVAPLRRSALLGSTARLDVTSAPAATHLARRADARRGRIMVAAASAAATELEKFSVPNFRRPLHWVFKVGDLQKSMAFYEGVLGMKVHRHEEFASGCEATCNGPYGGAWSKTMVGYGSEDTNFCLELTCNYVSCVVEEADAVHLLMTWGCGRNKGIDNYPAGNDYRYIAIKSSTVKPGSLEGLATTQAAVGFPCVATPDGYKFMLVDTDEGDAAEPFLFVSLNVSDLEAAKTFYCDGLGAKVVPGGAGTLGTADSCVLDFVNTPGVLAGGVKLELVQLPAGEALDHALAPGRFALETEDGAPDKVAAKMEAIGGTIAHGPFKLQPHGEEVVIVQDGDGHEYCFVDARGYTNCISVRDAVGGTDIVWDYRDKLHAAAALPTEAERKLAITRVLAGEYDAAAVREQIAEYAGKAGVVVFSQTSCPFCKKAKELLDSVGAKYDVVELDTLGETGYAIRSEFQEMCGRSTVPNVFIGGESVGGFTDGVEALQAEGKLKGMLEAAGAV